MSPPELNPTSPGPPISLGDQVNLLQQRGLLIPDPYEAERFLSNVNYYRFRGYLEPFVDNTSATELRPFKTDATFDTAVERHNFDTRLRTLLLEAFNYIEVSVRTQWTYHLSYSHGGGQHSHLNSTLFSENHGDNLVHLHKDYQKHGKDLHSYEFINCPTWAIAEVMSLGQLYRWYTDTDLKVRKLVADHYHLHRRVFGSLLRHLITVRNFCAHHELLWDREFITKFRLPNQMGDFKEPATFFNETAAGKLYNTLVMVAYLTRVITNKTEWPRNLVTLLNEFPNIPQDRMGFIANWQDLAIWKE